MILPGTVWNRQTSRVNRGVTLTIGAFLHRRRNGRAPEEVADEMIFTDIGAEEVDAGSVSGMR